MEKIEKEAVVAKFAVLSQHIFVGTEENVRTPVGIASDSADIRTVHLPYTRQELYRLRREGTNWKGRKNEICGSERRKRWNSTVWIGFIWLRLGTSGGFL
jgi:hypothetical protein